VKKILWTGVVVLLLVGGGAWWFFSSLDHLVATAIRSYGPQMTKVSVKLKSVKISAAQGSATVAGLELGNPSGFATERALSVGQISMTLDVASITQDVVRIKEIVIERPAITYEHATGGSNLDVIQRNVEAYVASTVGANKAAPQGAAPEKKFIIDNLHIKGANAQVSAAVLQGKVVSVSVPDFYLIDIGKKSGGITASQATRQVMNAMTNNVTKSVAFLKLDGVMGSVKKGAAAVSDKVKGWFK
jgi:uncharacterized protein involved in outer membrane biogenesis